MREAFIRAFQKNVDRFGVDGTLETFPGGPKSIIEMLINYGANVRPDMVAWIKANREEAEQIAAGILGLM
jgi:hypothetical protein